MASFWTYFTPCFSVSTVNFEHVIAGRERSRWIFSVASPQESKSSLGTYFSTFKWFDFDSDLDFYFFIHFTALFNFMQLSISKLGLLLIVKLIVAP